ncbi:MAG: hypothetical protein IJF20_08870, partial [Clostridia bacterium]|nr:hypothetical protein [Clostridia bacterium]
NYNFKRKIPSVKIIDFDSSPCVFKGSLKSNYTDKLQFSVQLNRALPPSDEGGGFCEAKDGGRDNKNM